MSKPIDPKSVYILMRMKNGETPLLSSPFFYKALCREIQPVHPGGDQSWVFIGRTDAEAETPILWPPDAKS